MSQFYLVMLVMIIISFIIQLCHFLTFQFQFFDFLKAHFLFYMNLLFGWNLQGDHHFLFLTFKFQFIDYLKVLFLFLTIFLLAFFIQFELNILFSINLNHFLFFIISANNFDTPKLNEFLSEEQIFQIRLSNCNKDSLLFVNLLNFLLI